MMPFRYFEHWSPDAGSANPKGRRVLSAGSRLPFSKDRVTVTNHRYRQRAGRAGAVKSLQSFAFPYRTLYQGLTKTNFRGYPPGE